MSSTTKNILLIVGGIIAAFIVVKLVLGVAAWLLGMLVPILIIGGIGYALYLAYGRKALGGGRRRTLP